MPGEAAEAMSGEEADRRAGPLRPTGDAMQMDIWYDAIQELLHANPRVSELLEDAEVTLEPDPAADEEELAPAAQ